MRGSASIASVDGTLSRGEKGRDLESVPTQSERQSIHVYLEQKADLADQGASAPHRNLSEAEADMNMRNWEQRNSDIALYETNRELYQTNLWADQAQRAKINLCGELEMKNRHFRENHAKDCQEIEELRRICCEETDRARQARIDELSLHQERNPATVI